MVTIFGKDYKIIDKIVFDGLTDTFVIQHTPDGASESESTLILREFLTDRFPDLKTCEDLWNLAQASFKFLTKEILSQNSLKLLQAIKDTGDEGPKFYLVFEYTPEIMSLRTWFQTSVVARNLSDEDLLKRVFLPLADEVQRAHGMNLVHRDLNFHSIYVLETMSGDIIPIIGSWRTGHTLVIDDIGVIPATIDDLPAGDSAMITPGFSAPEIVMGKKGNELTDVYGLGAIGYYFLTRGAIRSQEQHVDDFCLSPATLREDLPRELDFIIRKATSFEPQLRYHTVSAFIQDIRAYLNKDFGHLQSLCDEFTKSPALGLIVDLFGGRNVHYIPLDLNQMIFEKNGFFRFGKGMLEELAEFQNIADLEEESEQFSLSFSEVQNVFIIYEGRNFYETLVGGQPLPKNEWMPLDVGKMITFSQNDAVSIKIGEPPK